MSGVCVDSSTCFLAFEGMPSGSGIGQLLCDDASADFTGVQPVCCAPYTERKTLRGTAVRPREPVTPFFDVGRNIDCLFAEAPPIPVFAPDVTDSRLEVRMVLVDAERALYVRANAIRNADFTRSALLSAATYAHFAIIY